MLELLNHLSTSVEIPPSSERSYPHVQGAEMYVSLEGSYDCTVYAKLNETWGIDEMLGVVEPSESGLEDKIASLEKAGVDIIHLDDKSEGRSSGSRLAELLCE